MPALPDVGAVLAAHGITPGPTGYELAVLTGVLDARGWDHRVEELDPGHPSRDRFRAIVFRRTGNLVGGAAGVTRAYRGRGRTEEEALAQALAAMLARRP